MNICSYIPVSILNYVQQHTNEKDGVEPPIQHSYETVVMFADVSGYTAMCEAMALTGPGGEEYLAKNLNSYFELLVRTMSSQGGDVFKFAGDAVLVVWPPSDEKLDSLVRRAVQCGLEVSERLQDAVLSHGVRLSVKIGIGAGEVTILHLGGVYKRLEYLVVGDPLVQAFHAEHHATKSELVVSPESWRFVDKFFEADVHADGFAFVTGAKETIKKINVFKSSNPHNDMSDDVLKLVKNYIPTAIISFAANNDDKWINELRCVTVLFVNLGLEEKELIAISSTSNNTERVQRMHLVLRAVQQAVYKFEGSLNKFLMDDKGSTLIAVFGLPPLAHVDDTPRGVLAALSIKEALQQFELRPSIGITTGMAFCGVVGNKGRREYSILGDSVNLAARLMQHAKETGAGVICDRATEFGCLNQASYWHDIAFFHISTISVKGKSNTIEVVQPILKQTQLDPVNTTICNKMRKVVTGFDFNGDAELQRCQEIITTQCNLKFPKAESTGAGSTCVIVQAESGMGKTKLLLAIASKYSKDDVETIFGAGSSFDIQTPLRAWAEVFEAMLRLCQITNFRAYARKVLEGKGARDDLAPCLNDIFAWSFEETDESLSLDAGARLEHALAMMVLILGDLIGFVLKVKRRRGVIIVLEDAQFLDRYSWMLCHRAVRDTSNLILLIATRPLDTTHLGPFASPKLTQGFLDLRALPQCISVTIHPRTEQMIYKLMAQQLQPFAQNVKKFAFVGALGRFIIDKARGNPMYALELINYFITTAQIFVEVVDNCGKVASRTLYVSGPDKKQIMLKQAQDPRKYACPLPPPIVADLGSRLDRLSLSQQHILKVGAVIGNEVSLKLLLQGYHLEIQDKDSTLTREIKELVLLQILKDSSTDDDSEHTRYSFVNGCMRDVVLGRLMESHQSSIITRFRQVDPSLFQTVEADTKDVKESAKSFQDSVMEGALKMASGRLKSLRERYFVLFRDKLLYYASTDTSKGPKGEIFLGSETAVHMDPSPTSLNFILVPGPSANKQARYELIARDKEDANRWVDAIYKLTLEKMAKRSKESRGKSVLARGTVGDGYRYSQIIGALGNEQQVDRVFSESIKEGYLMKCGGTIRSSWKKRYFILFQDRLIYYQAVVPKELAPALLARHAPDKLQVKGEIHLSAKTAVELDEEMKATFRVAPELGGRKFVICAESEIQSEAWVKAIKEVCSKQIQASHKHEPTAKMANHSVMEGNLRKKGGTLGNWSTRYFVLFNRSLQYFAEKDKRMTGEIPLWRETEVTADPSDRTLVIVKSDASSKTYILGGKDEEEAALWNREIQAQCRQAPRKE